MCVSRADCEEQSGEQKNRFFLAHLAAHSFTKPFQVVSVLDKDLKVLHQVHLHSHSAACKSSNRDMKATTVPRAQCVSQPRKVPANGMRTAKPAMVSAWFAPGDGSGVPS